MASSKDLSEFTEALQLSLHGQRIGVLVHYSGGRNVLTFDPTYSSLADSRKPVFTLTQLLKDDYLVKPKWHSQRLPPVLSNLLPEGALRQWLSASLKTHIDNEFPLLAWTGSNLPGALVAKPLPAGEIPGWALNSRDRVEPVQINVQVHDTRFSLAGVQMKFSSLHQDGRFNISADVGADSWIIKTPSTVHRNVPANEYTAMKLAESIGVDIPEIQLLPLEKLDNLPDIVLPNESVAFAIRRFDRSNTEATKRIHTEDFAQIFELYSHRKYGSVNYEQIGRVIHQFSFKGLADVQQMARRLLANILLANGDAHLKNWSMIYPDQRNPRLSPAYDIVTTLAYVNGESGAALNMAREKRWRQMDMTTFEVWAKRMGVSWPAIRVHLADALEQARDKWPEMLNDMPMADNHKNLLQKHMGRLTGDFIIEL